MSHYDYDRNPTLQMAMPDTLVNRIADGFACDEPGPRERAVDGDLSGYGERTVRVGTDRMLDEMFGANPADMDAADAGHE